jgi:hypothetical protein
VGDDKECLNSWSAVVFPIVSLYIPELLNVYIPSTDVDDKMALWMPLLKELCYDIHGVSVELFNATGRECHRYDPISDVCQIKIVAVLLEAVLRATDYLPK